MDESIGRLKLKAHNNNNHLARMGLVRGRCSVCDKPNAHLHHVTYTKPYETIWLCGRHHVKLHYFLKNQNALVALMRKSVSEHKELLRLRGP